VVARLYYNIVYGRPTKKVEEMEMDMEMTKDKWMLVHLSRPADADFGRDKVYVGNILEVYPELIDYIRDHTMYPEDATENLVLDAHILDYPKIAKALLGDCKFTIVGYVDRTQQPVERKAHIEKLMNSVREIADDNTN